MFDTFFYTIFPHINMNQTVILGCLFYYSLSNSSWGWRIVSPKLFCYVAAYFYRNIEFALEIINHCIQAVNPMQRNFLTDFGTF